jgi:hypothetical protein
LFSVKPHPSQPTNQVRFQNYKRKILKACTANLWHKKKKSFAEELRSTVFHFKNFFFFFLFFFLSPCLISPFQITIFASIFQNYQRKAIVLRSYTIHEIFSSHIVIKIWTMMTEKRLPTTSYKKGLHIHQYLSIVFQRTCFFSAYVYFFYTNYGVCMLRFPFKTLQHRLFLCWKCV